MYVIDLSHEITNGMRVYPGDPQVRIERFLVHEKDYCHVDQLHMGTHAGTHIDAPYHFLSQGKAITAFSVENFIGKGIIIDVMGKEEGQSITNDDVKPYLEKLTKSDFVLFQSGWDIYFKEDKYLKHPYITKECAELLADTGIKLVGVDFLNVDSTITEQFDAHDVLLSKNIFIVENLCNLQFVNSEEEGWFHFVPLKIKDADGSPIRAYFVKS